MDKRILTVVAMCMALTLALVMYFKPWAGNQAETTYLKAIPKTVSLVIEVPDLYDFIDKFKSTDLPEEVHGSFWFEELTVTSEFLKVLIAISDSSGVKLDFSKFAIGITNAGSSSLGVLNVMSLKAKISEKNIESIKNQLQKNNIKLSVYNFKNQSIYTIEGLLAMQKYSFALTNGLLIGSFHASLVEEAVQAYKDENGAYFNADLKELLENHSFNGDLNVFFNISSANIINPLIFSNKHIKAANSIERLGSWTGLEVNFAKDLILLTGYTNFKQQEASLLSQLSTSLPVEITITQVLPDNTAYFCYVASTDIKSVIEKADESGYLSSWIDNQYAHFILETFDSDYLKRSCLIVKSKDNNQAKISLLELQNSDIPVDTISEIEIFEFRNTDLLNRVYGNGLVNFTSAYFVFVDSYVVFGADIPVLKALIQKYQQGKTLARDVAYKEFEEGISTKSNYFVYSNPSLWSASLNEIFQDDKITPSILHSFSLQFSNINNTFYTSAKIQYGAPKVIKSNVVWEVQLDTISIFRPQMVVNHINQSREIITQDALNNVYLINASGEIEFKVPVSGQILGKVHQIDFYNNKKLQFVFNTAEKIYVIDRTGANVGDYPLNLPANATGGMAVINYDKSNNYRFFVGCENGNLYGYEVSGKPLQGWSPMGDVGILSSPLQHNVLSGNDFLTFFNNEGVFYAVNRKGEPRFKPVNMNTTGFDNPFVLNNEEFVNGTSGQLYRISKSGALSVIPMADSTYNHYRLVKLKLQDSNAHAFASRFEFALLKTQVEKLASFKTDDEIISIESHLLKGSLWFALKTSSNVYLIDELGALHPDFPIATTSDVGFYKLFEGKDEVLVFQTGNAKLQVKEIILAK